jgi:hypothetical protein
MCYNELRMNEGMIIYQLLTAFSNPDWIQNSLYKSKLFFQLDILFFSEMYVFKL